MNLIRFALAGWLLCISFLSMQAAGPPAVRYNIYTTNTQSAVDAHVIAIAGGTNAGVTEYVTNQWRMDATNAVTGGTAARANAVASGVTNRWKVDATNAVQGLAVANKTGRGTNTTFVNPTNTGTSTFTGTANLEGAVRAWDGSLLATNAAFSTNAAGPTAIRAWGDVQVSGNVTAASLTNTGPVSASSLHGDGSGITNIKGTNTDATILRFRNGFTLTTNSPGDVTVDATGTNSSASFDSTNATLISYPFTGDSGSGAFKLSVDQDIWSFITELTSDSTNTILQIAPPNILRAPAITASSGFVQVGALSALSGTKDGSILTNVTASAVASGATITSPTITNATFRLPGGWANSFDANFTHTSYVGTNPVTYIKTNGDAMASGILTVKSLHYGTNTSTMAPDFNKTYSMVGTNAGFTFLAPLNVSPTNAQSAIILVTNITGSAVAVLPPANVHTQGTWYITNATVFTFWNYGGTFTNATALPLY